MMNDFKTFLQRGSVVELAVVFMLVRAYERMKGREVKTGA